MLSKAECLKILELGPKANRYEIENRYTMLIKRFRGQMDEDSIAALEKITLAYNILTGRHIEPEPANPRLETIVFGKSRRQWQNIWHYGRTTLLAIVIALAFLVYLVYTIATNKPSDFSIVSAGLYNVVSNADVRIEAYVKSVFPEFERVDFQSLPLDMRDTTTTESSTGSSIQIDSQNQYAYVMKMITLIAADDIEVFLCDKPVFNQYARQGAFADLTGLYARLQQTLPADVLAKVKPLRRQISEADDSKDPLAPGTAVTTQSTEDAANSNTSLAVYGLDVSALHLTEGLGLYCDVQILTIGVKANDPAKVETFLETWIKDYEKMHQLQLDYENSIKITK